MKRKVLVVDIGGTHVKLLMSVRDQRDFASGPQMRPKKMVAKFKQTVSGWKFDVVSIGFPAPVRKGHITREPKHLGEGNVRRFATFPEGIEPGQNENAFFGGLRLWETKRRARELKWRVL